MVVPAGSVVDWGTPFQVPSHCQPHSCGVPVARSRMALPVGRPSASQAQRHEQPARRVTLPHRRRIRPVVGVGVPLLRGNAVGGDVATDLTQPARAVVGVLVGIVRRGHRVADDVVKTGVNWR